MKAYKILTIITIIVLVAILSVASFMGVYKLKDYRVKNVVPNYLFGKEFSKSREVNLEIDNSVAETKIYDKDGNEITEKQEGIEYTEENGYTTVETKANSEDVLTKDNYKKAEKIIVKRMNKLGVEQYNIDLDEETGNIKLDITENDKTDEIITNLLKDGTFELKDSETEETLLDNSDIKSVKIVYGQTDSTSTSVYLQIKLDKEGTSKLEEISKTYVEIKKENSDEDSLEQNTEEQTDENSSTSEETEKKYVTLNMNGETITTTYFGESITNGVLNVPMGSATNSSSLQQYISKAKENRALLDSGILPIKYTQTNEVKDNSINIFENKIVVYGSIAIIALAALFLIIKLKAKGILAIVLQIGYVALLLLTVRYTNVKIAVGGIIGIAISIILNYIYAYIAFKNTEKSFIKEVTSKFALRTIPFLAIAIVFTFISITQLSSFGMTLFWGIIIMYIYNLILTQITIKTIN